MNIPKIYAIINFEDTTNPVEFAAYLLLSGITLIQLRNKSKAPGSDFLESAKKILEIKRNHYPDAKILINDHLEICRICGADGVHLGQTDESPSYAREVLGTSAIIGQSTHTPEQARKAPHHILNYLACGPVFHSKTKSGHAHELGLEGVREIKSVCPLPLVAIGGITLETAQSVLKSGADSVAMIQGLKDQKDLGEKLKNLKY